jgi:hypothetical protein
MTVHPQRWDDRAWPWVKELVAQSMNNVIKRAMIRFAKDEWLRHGGLG